MADQAAVTADEYMRAEGLSDPTVYDEVSDTAFRRLRAYRLSEADDRENGLRKVLRSEAAQDESVQEGITRASLEPPGSLVALPDVAALVKGKDKDAIASVHDSGWPNRSSFLLVRLTFRDVLKKPI